MAKTKACKGCHRIIEGKKCPVCKTSKLTTSWKGYTIIINPEKSEIAQKIGADTKGAYALRVKG